MDAADPGLSKRFWAKVNKSPDCWLWTASRTGIGVGQFRVRDEMWAAHRVAWSLVLGAPVPRCLRHGCGNLACVRPDHMVTADRRHGPTNLARTWERRFTSFIDKGPECWLWTGSANHVGHGQFDTYVNRKRHVVGAHRVAWELHSAQFPRVLRSITFAEPTAASIHHIWRCAHASPKPRRPVSDQHPSRRRHRSRPLPYRSRRLIAWNASRAAKPVSSLGPRRTSGAGCHPRRRPLSGPGDPDRIPPTTTEV
jgi:hypothetical protein